MKKWLYRMLAVTVLYLLIGTLLDSVFFPESEPGPMYYPTPGYQFVSRSEGFHQTLLHREKGLIWVQLELAPYAPGPPEHIHTSFAELFAVTEGTLSVLLDGQKRLVRAGETLLVPPGTPHKPFNETDSRVVVKGPLEPEYAQPELFAVFLTQAYGYFDESSENNRPPKALLQMSRFSPKYDVWLANPPVPVQKALYSLIRPIARLMGYRTHYEKYMPGI